MLTRRFLAYYIVFIYKSVVFCKGFVVQKFSHSAISPHISHICLANSCNDVDLNWEASRNALRKNLMLAVAICTLSLPLPSVALDKNPEALEMRRVMEQPAGAPEVVKRLPVKLPSGVQYFDYVDGDGAEVQEGRTVQFQWVLRRSNGYFVDASSNYGDEPFIYKVGNTKKVIKGVDEAIRGMKVGGVRRMNIPASSAFVLGVGDDKPGPMPAGFGPRRQIETRIDKEVWYFEIKVLKVR